MQRRGLCEPRLRLRIEQQVAAVRLAAVVPHPEALVLRPGQVDLDGEDRGRFECGGRGG